ncbi:hypothetical protein [Streptomyces sp. BE303]|uniref:DUF7144 family membrane protein n=1 Tax=Streptomycetaceae TaxID=2062 RepID=UPI002E7865B6|nr:hypothetical protein [Streptomyces sp. BE303]MED7951674.1 hypothetical protein [Streptomyces sp. BE303]
MSSTSTPPDQPPPWRSGTGAPPPPASATRFSDWAPGLVVFAGVLMLLNGIMEVLRGIMAVHEDEVFLSSARYVFRFDLTGWGWIHIVVGALVAVVGAFVLKGAAWARYTGVFLTAVSAADSFLAMPYYPFWSITVIALDVFIIWALCVYRPERTAS